MSRRQAGPCLRIGMITAPLTFRVVSHLWCLNPRLGVRSCQLVQRRVAMKGKQKRCLSTGVRYRSELAATRMLWSIRIREVQELPMDAMLRNWTSSAGLLWTMLSDTRKCKRKPPAPVVNVGAQRRKHTHAEPQPLNTSALSVRTMTKSDNERRAETTPLGRQTCKKKIREAVHAQKLPSVTRDREMRCEPVYSTEQGTAGATKKVRGMDNPHKTRRAVNKEPTIQETDR